MEATISTSHFKDIDGNTYKTIKIGKQEWMAENLNVSKFRNGDPIPEAKTEDEWREAGDKGRAAWCYYDNNPANGARYGKLYNWYAVNDPRGLAPQGWHISTHAEWQTIVADLGDDDVTGGKMKETGTSDWESPNAGATNESGFSALPGGRRYDDGNYGGKGSNTGFWTSTEDSSITGWRWTLNYDDSRYENLGVLKPVGLSVRCVKGEKIQERQPIFKTVKVGSDVRAREWMTENLNVNTFRNGDPIPEAKSAEEWENAGKERKPAWCYYENGPEKGKIYGKLYNWYAIRDPRGLAPEGWHISSDAEWQMLIDFNGGDDVAGIKLKESGTKHWINPNNASNESGFSALPGGYRAYNGKYDHLNYCAFFWTSSKSYDFDALYFALDCSHSKVLRNGSGGQNGYSVRCVRD